MRYIDILKSFELEINHFFIDRVQNDEENNNNIYSFKY